MFKGKARAFPENFNLSLFLPLQQNRRLKDKTRGDCWLRRIMVGPRKHTCCRNMLTLKWMRARCVFEGLSCEHPDQYRSLSSPSGPSVPENGGVRGSVPGLSQGPGLRSVQTVSRERPRGVKKVSRTLRGHTHDTSWTLPQTPPFSGTLSGTLPRTLRPKGPDRLL